jgi:hypothetical protein
VWGRRGAAVIRRLDRTQGSVRVPVSSGRHDRRRRPLVLVDEGGYPFGCQLAARAGVCVRTSELSARMCACMCVAGFCIMISWREWQRIASQPMSWHICMCEAGFGCRDDEGRFGPEAAGQVPALRHSRVVLQRRGARMQVSLLRRFCSKHLPSLMPHATAACLSGSLDLGGSLGHDSRAGWNSEGGGK